MTVKLRIIAPLDLGLLRGGNIKMKKFSYIGIASVLKHNIKIGENTVVGANSYVNKNCLDNKIYFGNPAKYQRKRKKKKVNLEDNLNKC